MTAQAGSAGGRGALLPSMRRLLVVAAVLVLLAGATLFLLPSRTEQFFAWTIASPMTAVFLGAAYWSAVVLELGGARARSWAAGRVAVPTVFVFTSLTLVATVAHLPVFHLGDEHAPLARAVAWAWLAVYVAVPVAMVVISIAQQRVSVPDQARVRRLPRPLRAALAALLAVLAVVGTGLFAAPAATASWWPWALTPLTAQAVGAWLVGLSVAAGHALVEDDVARVQPLGPTAVAFAVLQVVALARHGGELSWSDVSAWVYLAVLGVLLAVGGWILVARPRPAPG